MDDFDFDNLDRFIWQTTEHIKRLRMKIMLLETKEEQSCSSYLQLDKLKVEFITLIFNLGHHLFP